MTPAEMAALHALCFEGAKRWPESGLAAALAAPGAIFAHLGGGFVLGRVVLDEAELLTIAVPEQARGQGIGAALLRQFDAQARRHGATHGFLEVAAENTAARALYARAGWLQTGLRRGYYGPGRDALTLTRDLRAVPEN